MIECKGKRNESTQTQPRGRMHLPRASDRRATRKKKTNAIVHDRKRGTSGIKLIHDERMGSGVHRRVCMERDGHPFERR